MALAVTMAMAMSMLNRMGVTGIVAVTLLFRPRSITAILGYLGVSGADLGVSWRTLGFIFGVL